MSSILSILRNAYILLVNYKDMETMVKEGCYGFVDHHITSHNFPTDQKNTTGKVVLTLISFDREMSTKEVFEEFNKKGLRPAKPHELLEFLVSREKLPEAQDNSIIVALGFVWQDEYDRPYVLFYYHFCSMRHLYLRKAEGPWNMNYLFAAVCA
ncbi:MAG: hypothetical protein A3H02_01995 [Candidatus Niyogibacteria bacterium RIFCSPLOWO2_12_FULL_41_13]|uniref:Uncharacterized protein n=1 Tax=Candidatus Niyogibacteria bacterium RIFCSPLOWO2_12_FULL_41_13 TaxID=1801726 RepID=A0A1G2F154_9BACT|nr:MAG: hypothetical protein A3H02_01995 [Candidatus Niyogibacteria bacterium RIFCSPLOWO2_12_FULL_41_13]